MSLKNTNNSFGWLAKTFHWLIALLIITLWIAGSLMGDMENSPFKFTVFGLHKATGIVVLILAVLAFTWRATNPKPTLPVGLPAWQKTSATVLKYALYACMIAMPLSGWAYSSAAGYPVNMYGLFEMPMLIAKDDSMKHFYKETHEVIGNIILVLVGLHFAAALKHHFINKDGILRRMLP